MASARGSPIRPVVSRVKLPQPGRGQMRVSDITAGSGCADPQSRSGSARSAARSVPTPVLDASPGPVVTRHVRTPELRHGTTLESIHSVHSMHSMHSMHRSNSEMLVRSLQRTESSQGREEPVASDPGSARSADLHSTSFEASLPAASVWMPDASLPDLNDLGDLATKPPALPRSSTTEALPRAPPSRQATRTNSRSLRGGSKERPQSEPPHQAKYPNSGGRLPELLDEIEDHLLQQTVRPPADASGWLKETAQLEIYAEEMRKLLQTFKAPEAPPPRRAGRRNDRGVHAKPLRELSVLRGDKELRWARQQLKNCEREYLHLQQLLGSSEKQLVAELRQVKDSLEQEKRKVKHLEHESHKRERSMARVAARAGGGELSVLTVDGNTLAMREVERLEAELEVYQMKNSSLMKQVEGESHRLDQAMQSRESQNAKYEALLARLQSEDTKKRLAEERKQQDSQQREEDQLRAEIRQLQEARRISARTTERTLKERQKRLEELRQKQTEHEGHLMQLKSSVPRAPKASRRRDSREAKEAREVEVTKVSGDIDVAGQSPEAAEVNPSGVTQVDVDAEIRLEAENGPASGDGCHDLEELPLEDVNADSP